MTDFLSRRVTPIPVSDVERFRYMGHEFTLDDCPSHLRNAPLGEFQALVKGRWHQLRGSYHTVDGPHVWMEEADVAEPTTEVKLIEVRDNMTFIPAIAVRFSGLADAERYLMSRAGYGSSPDEQRRYVLFGRLDGGVLTYDPFGHGTSARTMPMAHQYLIDYFDEVESGQVVDVRVLAGEALTSAESERLTAGHPDLALPPGSNLP